MIPTDEPDLRTLFAEHEHLATEDAARRVLTGVMANVDSTYRPWIRPLLAAAVVLGLAGAGTVFAGRGTDGSSTPDAVNSARTDEVSSAGPPTTSAAAGLAAEQHALAQAAADEALAGLRAVHALSPALVLAPQSQLLLPEGDWGPLGESAQLALRSGQIDFDAALDSNRPPDGEIAYPDGTTAAVPVVSLVELQGLLQSRRKPCSECTPLVVQTSGVQVTTMPLETAHGRVMVPAWRLGIVGTDVHVLAVAVASSLITLPTPTTSGAVALEGWSIATDGRTLSAHFIAGPPGWGPCGSEFEVLAAQDEKAVALAVWSPRGPRPECDLFPTVWTLTVRLDHPLGSRPVLDAATRSGLGQFPRP